MKYSLLPVITDTDLLSQIKLKDSDSYLLVSTLDYELGHGVWNRCLDLLPNRLQSEISNYHRWQDRQNFLIGKYLVYLGYYSLYQRTLDFSLLQKGSYGKPFIKGESYQFNISHTENTVTCIFSKGRVGIDVEAVRDIRVENFNYVFSRLEMQYIKKHGKLAFYKYWTAKEAVSKAIGRGLRLPLIDIKLSGSHVLCDGVEWDVYSFLRNNIYYTVASRHLNSIAIQEVKFS